MEINKSDLLTTYAGQLVTSWTHYLSSTDYKFGKRGLRLGTCNELYLDVPYNLPVPDIDINDYDLILHIGEYDGAWAYTIDPQESDESKHRPVSVLVYELFVVKNAAGLPVSICMDTGKKGHSRKLTEVWSRTNGRPNGAMPKIAFISTEQKPSFLPGRQKPTSFLDQASDSIAKTLYNAVAGLYYPNTRKYPEPPNDGLYLTRRGSLLMKWHEHDDGKWMVLYDADHDRGITPGTALYWKQMTNLLGLDEIPYVYKGAVLNWYASLN